MSPFGGEQQSHVPIPPPTDNLKPGEIGQRGAQDISTASNMIRPADSGGIPAALLMGKDGGQSIRGGELVEGMLTSDKTSTYKEEETVDMEKNSIVLQCGVESACPRTSVASLSPTCESPVSECSTDLVSKRRSFSSLDTERYGGTLSNSANEIVRSHIGAPPTGPSRFSSDAMTRYGRNDDSEQDQGVRGIASVFSPIYPPSPPLKVTLKE